jgi:hypothetical protein
MLLYDPRGAPMDRVRLLVALVVLLPLLTGMAPLNEAVKFKNADNEKMRVVINDIGLSVARDEESLAQSFRLRRGYICW